MDEKEKNYIYKLKTFLPKELIGNPTVDALKFYIEKSKAKNIGVIGNYGSGKSSIINSYLSKTKLNYITVSLASFDKNTKDDSKSTNQQIEISVLQQLLLKRDNNKIELKKIFGLLAIIVLSISYILWVLFIFGVNILSSIIETVNESFRSLHISIVYGLIGITFLLLVFFISLLSLKIVDKFYFSKLSIKGIELKVEGKTKTFGSVISTNMKKILDTFSNRNIELVIFEDLDRYENEWIFVKLRELCGILNQAENSTNPVFVYSVKDELFSHKIQNRMKFFDAIIPIIPSMTSVNSFEVLKNELFSNLDADIIPKDAIIKEIGNYIYDRRMAINIFNEYTMYLSNLQKTNVIDYDQLFGFIVFKNAYPEDFTKLQENQGIFYHIINDINKHDSILTIEIDKEIKKISKTISDSQDSYNSNVSQIRLWYLTQFIDSQSTIKMSINNYYRNNIRLMDLVSDDSFDNLLNGNFQKNYPQLSNFTKLFNDFLNTSNFQDEYSNATNRLTENQRVNNLRIMKLRNKQNELISRDLSTKMEVEEYYIKIKEDIVKLSLEERKKYLDGDKLSTEIDDYDKYIVEQKLELFLFLISSGYISENYIHYISYFKEGRKSINDINFEKIVFNKKTPNYELTLSGYDKIIEDLKNPDLYDSEHVLNYGYLDYLCENNKGLYIDRIIDQIKSNFEERIDFIEGYVYSDHQIESFLSKLILKWEDFFDALISLEKIEKSSIYYIFEKFILMIDADLFHKLIVKNPKFTVYIEGTNDFSLFNEEAFMKLLRLFAENNRKFRTLDNKYRNTPIMNYISDNNLYKINLKNVEIVLNSLKKDSGLITQSKDINEKVYDYLYHNLITSVENLVIGNNQYGNENIDILIMLLNDEALSNEQKIQMLESQNGLQLNHKSIKDFDLILDAIEKNKIKVCWSLLEDMVKKEDTDQDIERLLSFEQSISDLENDNAKMSDETNESIFSKLVTLNINTNIFSRLIRFMNHKIVNIIEDINVHTLNILIDNNKILFNKENLVKLSNIKNCDFILFVIKNKQTLENEIEHFIDFFSDEMITSIWDSNENNLENKLYLLELIHSQRKIPYDTIIKLFKINTNNQYISIFNKLNINELKCILLDANKEIMTKKSLLISLENLGGNYKLLTSRHNGIVFPINDWNSSIINYLSVKANIIATYIKTNRIVVNTKKASNIVAEHNQEGVISFDFM